MIVQEIFHALTKNRKKKNKRITIKIDIIKAYDKME